MPIGQVNLHSATTEALIKRLAWFYTTAKQIMLFAQNIEFDSSLASNPDELCAKIQL